MTSSECAIVCEIARHWPVELPARGPARRGPGGQLVTLSNKAKILQKLRQTAINCHFRPLYFSYFIISTLDDATTTAAEHQNKQKSKLVYLPPLDVEFNS